MVFLEKVVIFGLNMRMVSTVKMVKVIYSEEVEFLGKKVRLELVEYTATTMSNKSFKVRKVYAKQVKIDHEWKLPNEKDDVPQEDSE